MMVQGFAGGGKHHHRRGPVYLPYPVYQEPSPTYIIQDAPKGAPAPAVPSPMASWLVPVLLGGILVVLISRR